MSIRINSRQFAFQLILVFAIFNLLTVVAVGIPMMIIFNRQVEAQMKTLFDQANRMTVALFENKLNQLGGLALLIAERPTLNHLLLDVPETGELDRYLQDISENINTDVVALCWNDELIGFAGVDITPEICVTKQLETVNIFEKTVWLLMERQLTVADLDDYHIVVGERFESIFDEFKNQSDLEYALYHQQRLVAVSKAELKDQLWQMNPKDFSSGKKLAIDPDRPQFVTHLAGTIPFKDQDAFTLVGLLDIGAYKALRSDMGRLIAIMLLAISLVGVVVAAVLARRISQPLNRLARSAMALRSGDLTTPLSARSQVWEIDQLTNALEDARVSLKYSLEQLQLEKAWIENLMNAVVEGLLTIDKYQRITFSSEATECILGVERAQITGNFLDDVFSTPGGENTFGQQLPDPGQSNRIAVVVDGRDILLSVSVSSLVPPDAGDGILALVIRDVTDEERIHRLMGDFLANITHEFRTPLTALSASVELLLNQLPGLSLPETEHLLQAINIGILDLQALIDNLIEASSIEGGRFKVNPKRTPLEAIISDAVNTIAPIVERDRFILAVQNPGQAIEVDADRRRTCQVLVNLLSNAIKHSPEGGTITIFSWLEGDVARVEVHDQGGGVPHYQRGNLFTRFITKDGKDENSQPGLGLGLTVVKAIVEAQGGSIGYKDGETGGAVFWFTLVMSKDGSQ